MFHVGNINLLQEIRSDSPLLFLAQVARHPPWNQPN